MNYKIKCKEVYEVTYEVEANDKSEAIELFKTNQATEIGSSEFIADLEDYNIKVELETYLDDDFTETQTTVN